MLILVVMYAHLGREMCVPRSGYMCTSVGIRVYLGRGTCVPVGVPGQTHQNYSDKNCNILNCKTLIINVLDLLILDIFRIFIV